MTTQNSRQHSKWIAVSLAGLMVLSQGTVYAAETSTNTAVPVLVSAPIGKANFTLAEANAMAEAASIELKTLDAKLVLAQREWTNAKTDATNADPKTGDGDAAYLEAGKKKEYYPLQKEKAYKDLLLVRKDTVRQLQKDVLNAYLEVFNKETAIAAQIASIKTLEKEYVIKKSEFTKGKLTKTTLKGYEVNLADQKLQLEKLESDAMLAELELNRLIKQPLTTDLKLTSKPALDTVWGAWNETALIESAVVNAKAVKDAKYTYDMAVLELGLIGKYTVFKRPDSYETLEKKIPDYKKAWDQAGLSEEVYVRTTLMSLKSSFNEIKMAELRVASAQDALTVEQARFKSGLVTSLSVTKAQDDLRSKQDALESAKLAYYKAKIDFEDYVAKLK